MQGHSQDLEGEGGSRHIIITQAHKKAPSTRVKEI